MENDSTITRWEELLRSGKVRSLGKWGYLGTGIYLTFIGLIATIGNGLVVILILKNKKLRKRPHNLLLLNMAISDLGISLFGYPLTTASGYAGRYLYPDSICVLQGFWCFTFAQASMNTLIPVSIYRYIAVCKAHLLYRLTRKFTMYVLVVVWLYTIAWTAPPLFGWNSYTFEPFGTSCSIDWGSQEAWDLAYTYVLIFSCYLLHIIVLGYCYYHIYRKTSQLKLHPEAPVNIDEAVKFKTFKAESKVTSMCIVMVTVLILVWSPYTFVCLWSVYKPDIAIWITTLPTMFAKLSSMLNPFIYAATNQSFRGTLQKMLRFGKNKVEARNSEHVEPRRAHVNDIFVVDRTKDDIYIGLGTVHVEEQGETSFF